MSILKICKILLETKCDNFEEFESLLNVLITQEDN